ncbi:nitrogen fixation protein [uncultured Thiothrix sp.]|uniref:nitrogen fixation protein n=1 Tax=uncultured Thiothrix sp. TaxID=223185 RepID=UPI002626DEE8|nr:nitrogen fixation protein [uncultured Thiothrix sp.]
MSTETPTVCPSANHKEAGAVLFAVVGGTPEQPEAVYLDKIEPITEEILEMAGPVDPTEVFRFAAPCSKAKCQHFNDEKSSCQLAAKVVKMTPMVVNKLAPCPIRSTCRWWQQEGVSGCQRCPQVVTLNYAPSEGMRAAATPTTVSA